MILEELYKAYATNQEVKELLRQSHWFASFADFDPKTGDTLPMPLSRVLKRMAEREPSPFVKDRLWLLMEHSRESARRLMKALSEEPRREPAYLPIREVRELDTASFIALSRRPGRNIREKLADKPYMQAVRHYQSIDVPENQLLKAFLMQLADAMELRKKYLRDSEVDDYLQSIYRWLNNEEIQAISRWENLAPNNALLSHRDYRRVWNSWRWLQSIDDDIDRDLGQLAYRRSIKKRWDGFAETYKGGQTAFADMPVFVDYNAFSIVPWDAAMPTYKRVGIGRKRGFLVSREPVCIDLTQLQPRYATPTAAGQLDENFFWQRWDNGENTVDMPLFGSDAVYAHADAVTATGSDLFFFRGNQPEILSQAARAFALHLKRHFRNEHLIWLMPDSVSEFELELVRRNLNASFLGAKPLPCSVAAVFKHIGYDRIARDGYSVAVVERINGKAYLTEMVARFDKGLSEALPETRGFIWEKGTSELISADVEIENVSGRIPVLLRDGTWTLNSNPYGVSHVKSEDVVMEYEGYDCAIWLNGRPVEGGVTLYQLQRRVPDIPLWRNHIPELMTKVMMDGYYQPFFFVGKDVTVQPVRGKAIPIPVPQEFTLPKGKKTYRLPLLQGSNEEAMEYEAKLVSKDFPYSEDVKCRLKMTYTYGADDPYHLVFVPLKPEYRQISVIWQLKEDVEINDAPGPAYPEPLSWDRLQNDYNPTKKKNTDLLEWCLSSADRVLKNIRGYERKPVTIEVTSDWKTNAKGRKFAFGKTSAGDSVYLSEFAFDKGFYKSKVHPGATLSVLLDTSQPGRYSALKAASNASDLAVGMCISIRKSMYVPFITVWAGGHTVSEPGCPTGFRTRINEVIASIEKSLEIRHLPDNVKAELYMLLAFVAEDLNASQSQKLVVGFNNGLLREKGAGFAIGSLSKSWQANLLNECLSKPAKQMLTVLAHAAWRNRSFILRLSPDVVSHIANQLVYELKELLKQKSWNEEAVEYLTRCLELLLGLLRSRDSENEACRQILQPSEDVTKQFAEVIEEVIGRFAKNPLELQSRVSLDLEGKAKDDKTPDLLYALQMYLTGDDAANAIRVTGIVEDGE